MNESLALLRQTAKDTGEEITGLENAMYNVISAAPALASNLGAAASIVDKAAKTAVGLGTSTEAVTSAMMNMGNALGMNLESVTDQEKILDILANTMKQGVIPSGEILARQIAKTAPAMKALSENSDDALNSIGSMTAILTANGVSMEESQTQIKAMTTELFDSAKVQKLVNAGVEGFDPETGKIADWSTFMKSAGENMDVLMKTVSSSEAQNAFRILADNGGKAFADLQVSMQNSGGTADTMFQVMADSSEVASKRLDASINDLKISAGSAVNTMVTDLTNMASSTIEFFSGLFGTTQQEYEALQATANQTMATATGISEALAGVSEALKPGAGAAETAAAFDTIKAKMGDITQGSEFLADQIKQIMNSPLGQTQEGLEKINGLLQSASDMANALALDDQIAAGVTQLDAFEETLEGIHGLTVGQGSALDEQTVKLREQEKLQKQLEAVMLSGTTSLEAKRQAQEALSGLAEETAKTRVNIAKVEKGISDTIKAQMAIMENQAKINKVAFDAEAAKEKILGKMVEKVGATEFLEERISELLDQQIDQKLEAEELAEIQIEAETAITEQMEAQGITADSSNAQRIEALNVIKVQNDAMIAQAESQIGAMRQILDMDIERIKVLNAQSIAAGGVALISEQEITNMRAVADATEARVKALKAQNVEIGKQISGLEAGAGAGAGAGARAGAGKGAVKAAEKADREAIKEAERAAKKAADIRKKEQQAQLKALEEKLKLQVAEHQQRIDQLAENRRDHKDRLKAEADMLKALKEFGEELKAKVNAVKDADFDTLGDIVNEFIPILDKITLKSDAIIDRFKATQEGLTSSMDELVDKNAALKASTDSADGGLRGVTNRIFDLQATLDGLNDKIKETSRSVVTQTRLAEQAPAAPATTTATAPIVDPALQKVLDRFGFTVSEFKTAVSELSDTRKQGGASNIVLPVIEAMGLQKGKGYEGLETAGKSVIATNIRVQESINSVTDTARDQSNFLTAANKERQAEADELQITINDLKDVESALTDQLEKETAEIEKNRLEMKALTGAGSALSAVEPITVLTAKAVKLAELLGLQREIAEIGKQAREAEDFETRKKLFDEMAAKQKEFNKDYEHFGNIAETILVDHAAVTKAIEDTQIVISQEQQKQLVAVKPMAAEYKKGAAEIKKLTDGFMQSEDTRQAFADSQLEFYLAETEHKKAMGEFDENEIRYHKDRLEFLQSALGMMEAANAPLKETQAIAEKIHAEEKAINALSKNTKEKNYAVIVKDMDNFLNTITNVIDKVNDLIGAWSDVFSMNAETMEDMAARTDAAIDAFQSGVSGLGPYGQMAAGIIEVGQAVAKIIREARTDEARGVSEKIQKEVQEQERLSSEIARTNELLDITLEIRGRINDIMVSTTDEAQERLIQARDDQIQFHKIFSKEVSAIWAQDFEIARSIFAEGFLGESIFDMYRRVEQEILAAGEGTWDDMTDVGKEMLDAATQEWIDSVDMMREKVASATSFEDPEFIAGMISTLRQAAINAGEDVNQAGELLSDVFTSMADNLDMVLDNMKAIGEERRNIFRDEIAEVEHRKKMGKFDGNELGFLEEKKAIQDRLAAQAIIDFNNDVNGIITQRELWSILEEQFSLEQAIFDLKNEGGELDQAALERLREMNKERQALILAGRGGEITEADRERVAQLEKDIIAEMTAAGATPEAIAAAKAGFVNASFAGGSPELPSDMIAQVHKGERILTSMENKDLINAVRQGMQANPFENMQGFLRMWNDIQAEKQAAGIGQAGANVFAPVINVEGGSDPQGTADAVATTLRDLHTEWHQQDGTNNGR